MSRPSSGGMGSSGPRGYARGCATNAFLLLISLFVAGLVSEGVARWFFPSWAPRTAVLSRLWHHDPVLGWSHVPGAAGEFNAAGFESQVTINSKGYRDLERSHAPDSDRYRIVMLGDSMVWGYGVQDDETFTRLMEKYDADLEVINLGVSGYGTDQELLLLEQEGLRYQPDLVVVFISQNDFVTNVLNRVFIVYEKPMFVLGDNEDLVLTNSPVPEPRVSVRRLMARLARSFYVVNRAGQVYNRLTSRSDEPWPPAVESEVWDVPFPRAHNEVLTVALLRRIAHAAQGEGAEVLFVLVDGIGPVGTEVEEFFSDEVPVLNLAPLFAGQDYSVNHVDMGGHWSVLGHEKVARRLIEYLKSEGLGGTKLEVEEPARDTRNAAIQ